MAENSRPPVAIRIVRPYETEDELLDNELETIGKTSVVLIGAHPRPTGVILRFEVTLASGPTVLRGEGRVLAHKENAFRGQAGLTLRFTRLDPKSKAIVDRATAMREARMPSSGGSPSRPPPPAASPIADALSAMTPAPGPTMSAADQEAAVAHARAAAREKANATARANARRTAPPGLTPPPAPAMPEPQRVAPEPEPQLVVPVPVPVPEPEELAPTPQPTPVTSIPGLVEPIARNSVTSPTISAPPVARTSRASKLDHRAKPEAPAATTDVPPNRDELLARLRERAGTLPRERVEEIPRFAPFSLTDTERTHPHRPLPGRPVLLA